MKNIYKVPDGKLLKIKIEIQEEKIESIRINGDFFAYPEDSIELIEKALTKENFEKESISKKVQETITSNNLEVYGFDNNSLADAIMGCKK